MKLARRDRELLVAIERRELIALHGAAHAVAQQAGNADHDAAVVDAAGRCAAGSR